jgi:SPP1 family predicted phage head-tail adaptor
MDAGKLTNRVVIERRSTSTDALGQPYTSWTTVATVWAWIAHLNGIEAIKAGADTSLIRTSIRIRWRTDVTAAMRIRHNTDVYEIKAVLPRLQSGDFIDMVCQKID